MAIRIMGLSRGAFGIGLAVAMLAGCGSQTQGKGTWGVMLMGGTSTQAKAHKMSGSSEDLLYMSARVGDPTSVIVFEYPKGKRVDVIDGVGALGLCSDEHGNVFMTDGRGQEVLEYAHGGGQIATLDDEGNYPQGCSVDAKTGNLATVGSYDALGSANVTVYPNTGTAFGSPTTYTDSLADTLEWCSYDGAGNLFVSGSSQRQSVLDELPEGQTSLARISVNHTIAPGGAVQWDGKYLAIANPAKNDNGPATIYQVKISGLTGQIAHTVTLNGERNKNDNLGPQLDILGNTIIYPESVARDVGLWHYPAGGKPTRKFAVRQQPWGLTVSVAPSGSHVRQ